MSRINYFRTGISCEGCGIREYCSESHPFFGCVYETLDNINVVEENR